MNQLITNPNVMVVVGEPSADSQMAPVLRSILESLESPISFWGLGGPSLQALGLESIGDLRDLSVMGLTDVIAKYEIIRNLFGRLIREAEIRKPKGVILVDFSSFNLRLAEQLWASGFKVHFHIPPKVWAHGKNRVYKLKRFCASLSGILPFEKEWYKAFDIPFEFVGNPLKEGCAPFLDPFKSAPSSSSQIRIGLVPGSRESELTHLVPVFIKAFDQLKRELVKNGKISSDQVKGFWPLAPTWSKARVLQLLNINLKELQQKGIEIVERPLPEVISPMHYAFVCSGTAGLETTFLEVPHSVSYITSALTYWVGTKVVTVPFISLENLCAGKLVVPEFIQSECTCDHLVKEAARVLLSDEVWNQQKQELKKVNALFPDGSVLKAAQCLLHCVKQW